MGLKYSIAMGYRLDSNNTFVWEKVELKFPETEEYDCQRPRVSKRRIDGLLDADLFIYVDDGWTIKPTNTLRWKDSRRLGSTCS